MCMIETYVLLFTEISHTSKRYFSMDSLETCCKPERARMYHLYNGYYSTTIFRENVWSYQSRKKHCFFYHWIIHFVHFSMGDPFRISFAQLVCTLGLVTPVFTYTETTYRTSSCCRRWLLNYQHCRGPAKVVASVKDVGEAMPNEPFRHTLLTFSSSVSGTAPTDSIRSQQRVERCSHTVASTHYARHQNRRWTASTGLHLQWWAREQVKVSLSVKAEMDVRTIETRVLLWGQKFRTSQNNFNFLMSFLKLIACQESKLKSQCKGCPSSPSMIVIPPQ